MTRAQIKSEIKKMSPALHPNPISEDQLIDNLVAKGALTVSRTYGEENASSFIQPRNCADLAGIIDVVRSSTIADCARRARCTSNRTPLILLNASQAIEEMKRVIGDAIESMG